ncbi:MAG TPA: DUF58 domain-containing protein [Acidimicrobiales bacterium]|nr:DUF58 domain-containing protein [Acidimicrobiales bacterium]
MWPFALGLGIAVAVIAVAAVLAADLLLAPRPGTIGVNRHLPTLLSLGDKGEVSWILSNPHRRSLRVAIADELAPSLGASARRAKLNVPAGGHFGIPGTLSVRAVLTPTRRGLFTPTELVVRTEGPLGLMARQSPRRLAGELRVYPSFGSRREAELRIERNRILEVGLRSARSRGGGTEFEQLREYAVDDDSRRIDWAATARSDKPIVRTYRAERNQRVISLLDNGRTMAGQVAGVARVEHAMDAVMMLTSVAARMGDMAGLVAFDRQLRAVVPPASRSAQLGLVTEALYRLQPELTQSDYRGAFVEVLARFQRRAMLCLLTELDEAIVDTLVPSLPMIARTHLLVVGAVRDPAVAAWAASMPEEMESAYRGAAAAAALARRRELATLLQGHGAVVVDALPGRLGPELTDTYLAAKASGRL